MKSIEAEIEKARQRRTIRLSAAQKIFLRMPWFVRYLFYSVWMNSPVTRKKYFGNVYFSAGGMTGMGTGWGLPVPMHPIGLFAGSMSDKPVAVNGSVEIRRMLHLTFTADHRISDGGQLARFMAEFFKTVKTETDALDV